MTNPALRPAPAPLTPRPERRGSPLLAATRGRASVLGRRQDSLSRPADPGWRGFPGPASPPSPHCTPVPTPARPTPRAIRVRRSPR